ncbi:MAG: beta-eliminating lyase-related protein [Merdibacter sp.]
MISFANDYSEGACDEILRAMIETNHTQTAGLWPGCALRAGGRAHPQGVRNTQGKHVHFLVGGTQCNKTLIAAALRPHEAVICADTGHINVHETGAVENSGHKVIALRADDGKVRCSDIEQAVKKHTDEHMVKPKMVYLSNATELARFIRNRSSATSGSCAAALACICSWTAQGWAMRCARRAMI